MLARMDVDRAVGRGVSTLNLRQAVPAGANIIVAWRVVFKDGIVAVTVAAVWAATSGAPWNKGDDEVERLLLRATGSTATGYARVGVPSYYPVSGAVSTIRRHGGSRFGANGDALANHGSAQ